MALRNAANGLLRHWHMSSQPQLATSPTPPCSYFRGRIRWEAAGHIAANCWASAMPIASFTPVSLRHSSGNRQRLAANVLLGVLVAARAAVLLRRLLRKLRAQQRSAAGTAGAAGGSAASSAAASRAASFLRSLSLRRRPPQPAQQQTQQQQHQQRAAPPSLLVVAVADRLLLLDLVTVALMLLALVLLSTSLAVSAMCKPDADASCTPKPQNIPHGLRSHSRCRCCIAHGWLAGASIQCAQVEQSFDVRVDYSL